MSHPHQQQNGPARYLAWLLLRNQDWRARSQQHRQGGDTVPLLCEGIPSEMFFK